MPDASPDDCGRIRGPGRRRRRTGPAPRTRRPRRRGGPLLRGSRPSTTRSTRACRPARRRPWDRIVRRWSRGDRGRASRRSRLETTGPGRQAAGGGLVGDEPPGLQQAGQHERAGVGIPSGQLVDLEEPRPVDPIGEAAGRHGGVDLVTPRPVAAEHQVPGTISRGGATIASEGLDQPHEVLLGHEPADRQEVRGVGEARATRRDRRAIAGPRGRSRRCRRRCIPGRCGRPASRAAPGSPGAPGRRRSAASNRRIRRLLISSFHQTRGLSISWLSDMRTAGRRRRAAQRSRGDRLGPRVSHDPHRVGPVVLQRLEHGPSAGVGLDRLEDAVGEQRDPLEGLVAAAPRPGIGPFRPRDLVGDQPVAAGRQPVRQGAEPGQVVGTEVGEAERKRHRSISPPYASGPGRLDDGLERTGRRTPAGPIRRAESITSPGPATRPPPGGTRIG